MMTVPRRPRRGILPGGDPRCGSVLERVNAKFGTGFSSFVHSEDNVKCVFDRIEEVHRAMRGDRLDEKVIAYSSAVKAGQKEGPGSPGGKEAHHPGRRRLRQLWAYRGHVL